MKAGTCTSRGEALAASLSESWLNHKALSLSPRIWPFIRINFRLTWSWLSFAFYPRTFLCSGVFMIAKWIGFESVTTVIECKQKMLLSWNRVFAAKSRWGVSELWWLWHLASLLTLINKSLFVNNLHIFFIFHSHLLGNDTLKLKFPLKKKDQCSPSNIWSNVYCLEAVNTIDNEIMSHFANYFNFVRLVTERVTSGQMKW